jgi:hypothetical protein
MKAALIFAAVLMSSLTASAQTITFSDQQVSLTIAIPGSCLVGGAPETVTLSGLVRVVLSKTLVNGKNNGFLVWAGTLTGKGSLGRFYTATGSHETQFTGQDVYTDGDFVFTDNFRLNYAAIGTRGVTFHDRQEFVITDNGNHLSILPEEKVCR